VIGLSGGAMISLTYAEKRIKSRSFSNTKGNFALDLWIKPDFIEILEKKSKYL
jgi:hypothetical protein